MRIADRRTRDFNLENMLVDTLAYINAAEAKVD